MDVNLYASNVQAKVEHTCCTDGEPLAGWGPQAKRHGPAVFTLQHLAQPVLWHAPSFECRTHRMMRVEYRTSSRVILYFRRVAFNACLPCLPHGSPRNTDGE